MGSPAAAQVRPFAPRRRVALSGDSPRARCKARAIQAKHHCRAPAGRSKHRVDLRSFTQLASARSDGVSIGGCFAWSAVRNRTQASDAQCRSSEQRCAVAPGHMASERGAARIDAHTASTAMSRSFHFRIAQPAPAANAWSVRQRTYPAVVRHCDIRHTAWRGCGDQLANDCGGSRIALILPNHLWRRRTAGQLRRTDSDGCGSQGGDAMFAEVRRGYPRTDGHSPVCRGR